MILTPHEIEILNEIYTVVDDNQNKNILVADIVSYYKISESTLTKAYRHLFHKTIGQHRLENTMTQAKAMIEDGVSIKTVAIELRYASTRTFTKSFKKYYGIVPSKYQQYCNIG